MSGIPDKRRFCLFYPDWTPLAVREDGDVPMRAGDRASIYFWLYKEDAQEYADKWKSFGPFTLGELSYGS